MTANKDLNFYLALPYTIELIPDEDGFWFAQIPLLRGCMTQSASRSETLDRLRALRRPARLGHLVQSDA